MPLAYAKGMPWGYAPHPPSLYEIKGERSHRKKE